jgi:hypothetical protein
LKGKAIAPPDAAKNRLWSHELSGRLRSLATDVVADANVYCEEMTRVAKQTKTFSGVIYCSIPEARQKFGQSITTQVHYTPLPRDNAHADFAFTGTAGAAEEIFDDLRLWLIEHIFTGLHPAQMKLLPAAKANTTGNSLAIPPAPSWVSEAIAKLIRFFIGARVPVPPSERREGAR